MFLLLIDIGYACGITSKLITTFMGNITTQHVWLWYFGLAVYILNFVMVSTDLTLYFYYRSKEKKLI